MRHDDRCSANGLEVWPTPDVVTWSALVERMYATDRQAGRTAGRWLPDAAARLVWERIGQQEGDGHLVSPRLLGRSAYSRGADCTRSRFRYAPSPATIVPRPARCTLAGTYSDWLDSNRWVDESLLSDSSP